MAFLSKANDSSLSAHAGIDHNHMNGTPWKISEGGIYDQRSLFNIVPGDVVRNINDARAGVYGQDDSFYHAYILILKAKIGKQGYNRGSFHLRITATKTVVGFRTHLECWSSGVLDKENGAKPRAQARMSSAVRLTPCALRQSVSAHYSIIP
jgi:hypothetical protein